MADIATEESSPTVLGSPRPDPANRFFNVKPNRVRIGPTGVALTGDIHAWSFRVDYTIEITIKHLSPSQWDDMLYMQAWLDDGGAVTMNTDDVDGNSYTGLKKMPGTEVTIENDDDERQHYSFTCTLKDSSPIVVNYDG